MNESLTGTVVVFQDRMWFGNPKQGAFVVNVDGKRAGVAPVNGELVVAVTPGSHQIRVRQWRFRSPAVEITVGGGETVLLSADIPRSLGFAARMALFLTRPSKCLVLARADALPSSIRRAEVRSTSEGARKGMALEGVLCFIGAVLVINGLNHKPALIATGAVLFVVGTALGIASVVRARRT
jgi:hypothetical protein